MRDAPDAHDSGEPCQALAVQALLYASGGLAEAEAAAFERRLAEDQASREALAQAVPLALALRGQAVSPPNPAYRTRVRQRLLPRRFRGHPAYWAGLGAAAGVLVMLGLGSIPRLPPVPGPVPSDSSP